jgi:fumarylacetoacetase
MKFINDNDTVAMRGYCQNSSVRILGFGEVSSKKVIYRRFVRK